MESESGPPITSLCHYCSCILDLNLRVGQLESTPTWDDIASGAPSLNAETGSIFHHHESFEAFEKSAAKHCLLCALFLKQIPQDERLCLRKRTELEASRSDLCKEGKRA